MLEKNNTTRDDKNNRQKAKTVKKPRKITPDYLHNAGLYYLERFSSSVNNFKRVMKRKIDRSCAFHETNPVEAYEMLDKVTEKFVELGLLNDEIYSRTKTSAMRRKGGSRRKIKLHLREKGLDQDIIDQSLISVDSDTVEQGEDPELNAAMAYIKRRRIGVFRRKQDEKSPEKDLASLARAGYSYDIAKKALERIAQKVDNNEIF